MTEAARRLVSAREHLHDIFARYPLGAVEGCPCCVGADDQAALRAGDLSRYAVKALTTWGDVDDFRHFLPALFDAALSHEGDVDFAMLLGKVTCAGWEHWPDAEQIAVRDFLTALWHDLLAQEGGALRAREFLEGAARIGDIDSYSRIWAATRTLSAALHLAESLCEEGDALLQSAARVKDDGIEQQLRALYTRDWVRDALEAAFFGAPNDEAASRFSHALGKAERLRQAVRGSTITPLPQMREVL